MSGLLFAFAVLSDLGPRPESLTGPLGQPAYKAAIDAELALDGIDVRIARYFGNCKTVMLDDDGYDLLVSGRLDYAWPAQTLADLQTSAVPEFSEQLPLSPVAGNTTAAVEHIRAAGCGKTYRLNLHTAYIAPKTVPEVGMIAPGHSLASPGMQSRVEADVVNRVQDDRHRRPDIKCGMVPLVYDVRVVAPPVAGGQWREQWDTYYCEASQTTEVTFTPSAEGNMIAVDGKLISSR